MIDEITLLQYILIRMISSIRPELCFNSQHANIKSYFYCNLQIIQKLLMSEQIEPKSIEKSNPNSSKSGEESFQNSSATSVMLEYANKRSIKEDSNIYRSLSSIASAVDLAIRTDRQQSILESGILTENIELNLSGNKQSLPAQLSEQKTEKIPDKSQSDYYSHHLYGYYQQMLEQLDKEIQRQKKLEQENKLISLMMNLEKGWLKSSPTELKIVAQALYEKMNKYEKKHKTLKQQIENIRGITFDENP